MGLGLVWIHAKQCDCRLWARDQQGVVLQVCGLVARCLETIDVCIWRMFVFMSAVVIVWGSVGMYDV